MEYKMIIHNAKDKLPLKSGTYLVKTSDRFNVWQVLGYSIKFKKFNTYDSQDNDKDAIDGYMWAELPGDDSEVEGVACPDCNGSGVYQEYDEHDRYHVYACGKCDGAGEIIKPPAKREEGHFPEDAEKKYNQAFEDKCTKTGVNVVSVVYPISEEVAEAIEKIEKIVAFDNEHGYRVNNCHSLHIRDIKTALKALQAYQPWIPVSERLPEKPEYDWVLVHITLYPDGFVGLPHIAELRRGEWFSTEYDLPIEQILQGTVTHWKPLPEPPKGE